MGRRSALSESGWTLKPIEKSPLRVVDPRVKLALGLSTSLAVMLPLQQLVVAMIFYLILLAWARLLVVAAWQIWRIKWVLVGLFIIDWIFVSLDLAIAVTLRLSLLASTFTLFFSTTSSGELRLALDWFRIPNRYAFSLSLAFQSLGVLDQEWRIIREAQQARGAWVPPSGWRRLLSQMQDFLALTVPAVVMTTKRAWAMTEAAHACGFGSPKRRPFRSLQMKNLDWFLLVTALGVGLFLLFWRV